MQSSKQRDVVIDIQNEVFKKEKAKAIQIAYAVHVKLEALLAAESKKAADLESKGLQYSSSLLKSELSQQPTSEYELTVTPGVDASSLPIDLNPIKSIARELSKLKELKENIPLVKKIIKKHKSDFAEVIKQHTHIYIEFENKRIEQVKFKQRELAQKLEQAKENKSSAKEIENFTLQQGPLAADLSKIEAEVEANIAKINQLQKNLLTFIHKNDHQRVLDTFNIYFKIVLKEENTYVHDFQLKGMRKMYQAVVDQQSLLEEFLRHRQKDECFIYPSLYFYLLNTKRADILACAVARSAEKFKDESSFSERANKIYNDIPALQTDKHEATIRSGITQALKTGQAFKHPHPATVDIAKLGLLVSMPEEDYKKQKEQFFIMAKPSLKRHASHASGLPKSAAVSNENETERSAFIAGYTLGFDKGDKAGKLESKIDIKLDRAYREGFEQGKKDSAVPGQLSNAIEAWREHEYNAKMRSFLENKTSLDIIEADVKRRVFALTRLEYEAEGKELNARSEETFSVELFKKAHKQKYSEIYAKAVAKRREDFKRLNRSASHAGGLVSLSGPSQKRATVSSVPTYSPAHTPVSTPGGSVGISPAISPIILGSARGKRPSPFPLPSLSIPATHSPQGSPVARMANGEAPPSLTIQVDNKTPRGAISSRRSTMAEGMHMRTPSQGSSPGGALEHFSPKGSSPLNGSPRSPLTAFSLLRVSVHSRGLSTVIEKTPEGKSEQDFDQGASRRQRRQQFNISSLAQSKYAVRAAGVRRGDEDGLGLQGEGDTLHPPSSASTPRKKP